MRFLLTMLLPSIALAAQDPRLVGSWEGMHSNGIPFSLVVDGKERCLLYGEPSRCSSGEGRLVLQSSHVREAYEYEFKDSLLVIRGGDLDETVFAERVKEKKAEAEKPEKAKVIVAFGKKPQAPVLSGEYRSTDGEETRLLLCADRRWVQAKQGESLRPSGEWNATEGAKGTLLFVDGAGASSTAEFERREDSGLSLDGRAFRLVGPADCSETGR